VEKRGGWDASKSFQTDRAKEWEGFSLGLNFSDQKHKILMNTSMVREEDRMAKDLVAKLVLSRDEVIHLYHGGVLSVKIKGKDLETSVEVSCRDVPEKKATRIRFKTIEAQEPEACAP